MKIYGIDFTSAPSRRKPIVVAAARAEFDCLVVEQVIELVTLDAFAELLDRDEEWYAGLDFPFGQPRKLIDNVRWPHSWAAYVGHIGGMTKDEFVGFMRCYQKTRARGDIRHFRRVDKLASACSPMQLDFVPVAKMFYAGATRLLNSSCSVYPFYSRNQNRRVAVEAYPALAARGCIGDQSYKTDNRKNQTLAQRSVRQAIVDALTSTSANPTSWYRSTYGFEVTMPAAIATEAVNDGTGDRLDAVLCALQAIWSYSRRDTDFGVDWCCDPLEGWIVDPSVLH